MSQESHKISSEKFNVSRVRYPDNQQQTMETVAEDTGNQTRRTDEDINDEEDIPQQGCGILGRYPVLSVLIFASIGVGLGVSLSCTYGVWESSIIFQL